MWTFVGACVAFSLGFIWGGITFGRDQFPEPRAVTHRTRYWVDGCEYCHDCAQRRVDFLEESLNWHPEIRVVREAVEV